MLLVNRKFDVSKIRSRGNEDGVGSRHASVATGNVMEKARTSPQDQENRDCNTQGSGVNMKSNLKRYNTVVLAKQWYDALIIM